MKNILLFLFLFTLFLTACDKDDDKEETTTQQQPVDTTQQEEIKYPGNLLGVLKSSEGLLIDNAYVLLHFANNDTLLVKQTRTNENGEFSFLQIIEGEYKISAYIRNKNNAGTLTIDVEPYIDNQVTFIYDNFVIISGNVTNQNDEVVVGAEIQIEHLLDLKAGYTETTLTDEDGDFFFYDIPEGISELSFTDDSGVEFTKRFKYQRGVIVPPPFEFEYFEGDGQTEQYFTDNRDGKVYRYVTIGEQTWMAENLAYLPQVDNRVDGSEDNFNGLYYYVYNFTPDNLDDEDTQIEKAKLTGEYQTYGVLYNWNAAMNGNIVVNSNSNPSGIQGVCPDGWHLPSNSEWDQLSTFIQNSEGLYPGKALKSTGNTTNGTGLWQSHAAEGIDKYGFSAHPAGYRHYNNNFYNISSYAYFWTSYTPSTSPNYNYAYYRGLYYNNYTLNSSNTWKRYGYSVRCVKD